MLLNQDIVYLRIVGATIPKHWVFHMKNLDEITKSIEEVLDEKDAIRELALKSSRTIARLANYAIRSIHRGEDIKEIIEDAREEVSKLKSALSDHPDLFYSGFVENAHQEFSEACIVHAIRNEQSLPTPAELDVTPSSYLLGLGDVVGELRRFALDALRDGKLAEANEYLDMMEDIYVSLMRFDYPMALVAIKRKQDIARSLLEKTRGEIAVASTGKQLMRKMEELRERL